MCRWLIGFSHQSYSNWATCRVRDLSEDRRKVVRDRFDRLGPIARICFGKDDDFVAMYEAEVQESIKGTPDIKADI